MRSPGVRGHLYRVHNGFNVPSQWVFQISAEATLMLDKDPSENGREVEGKGLHKELLAIVESEVLV